MLHNINVINGPVYLRSEVKSNWFEISISFENLFDLHGDFTAEIFQTVAGLYCTDANDRLSSM